MLHFEMRLGFSVCPFEELQSPFLMMKLCYLALQNFQRNCHVTKLIHIWSWGANVVSQIRGVFSFFFFKCVILLHMEV